ncbi:hypothetical protein VKT23_015939 [Stygiomarasmius scandens]|uniref:F-box domain-containing protein n=1 Tax=Marasmiellus scandens TaxID=2682957 RepID=A0ABR1IZL3_9AGAR
MQRLQDLELQLRVNSAQLEAAKKKEVELLRLQHEIQRMVYDATAERRQLEEQKADLEAQRLPINWLPSEILLEIFGFLCYDHRDRIPQGFPTLQLSHVSKRWRKLSLGTSHLWSHIWFSCTGWSKERIMAYIDRSGTAPLDIVFGGRDQSNQCTTRTRRVVKALSMLEPVHHRCRSILLECSSLDPAYCLTETLNDSSNSFPVLTSVGIAVTHERFSYASFPFADRDEAQGRVISSISPSLVRNISLQCMPLLSLPLHFFLYLKTLEISLPNALPNREAPVYASHFLTRLSYTHQLEELTLSNVAITFDVGATSDPTSVRRTTRPGILKIPALPRLRHLTWSFPPPKQIPRFLSLLSLPNLEKLDLWIDAFSPNESTSESQRTLDARLHYPRLRELCLQCMHPDTLSSALRTLTFPDLRRLEIVDVESRAQRQDHDGEIKANLAVFPRFESILHEPRLLRLSSLILSDFSISLDWGSEMLGYIPALESLTLEGCNNASVLISALAQRVPPVRSTTGIPAQSTYRLLRFCPRLQVLSLIDCAFPFKVLEGTIKARNGNDLEDVKPDARGGKKSKQPVRERVIRPLPGKGGRLQRPSAVFGMEDECEGGSGSLAVRMAEMILDVEPTRISYVQILGCDLVSFQEADSLEEYGIEVVWGGRS